MAKKKPAPLPFLIQYFDDDDMLVREEGALGTFALAKATANYASVDSLEIAYYTITNLATLVQWTYNLNADTHQWPDNSI